MGTPVHHFVVTWGLDQKAQTLLYNLDPSMQVRVAREFSPTDLSKGASAAFQGFVNGVLKHSKAHASVYAAVDAENAFVEQWGLDAKAVDALHRLDAVAKQRVMAAFAPNDTSRGASVAFMGFAKSVAATAPRAAFNGSGGLNAATAHGGSEWSGPTLQGSGLVNGEVAVDAFVEQWNLDEKAQEALRLLAPDIRQRVMADFSPQHVQRGASVAFMGFLRSVVAQASAQPSDA